MRCKENIFYNQGAEALEQVAQRGGRCPFCGNFQGKVRQKSDLVEGVHA